jgi:toxin ParE1/3/4
MDFRIIWSEVALADLRSLVRYIARDNGQVAARFGRILVSKVDPLAKFPRIGRMVPEFATETLRQIVVSPYRIIYEIDDQMATVAVLRVWHGARDRLDESTLKPAS